MLFFTLYFIDLLEFIHILRLWVNWGLGSSVLTVLWHFSPPCYFGVFICFISNACLHLFIHVLHTRDHVLLYNQPLGSINQFNPLFH